MPALSPAQILSTAVDQVITGVADGVYARDATDATARGLEVICAWPVSGQYGPGTRILYVLPHANRLRLVAEAAILDVHSRNAHLGADTMFL